MSVPLDSVTVTTIAVGRGWCDVVENVSRKEQMIEDDHLSIVGCLWRFLNIETISQYLHDTPAKDYSHL